MYRCHCGKEGDELTVTGNPTEAAIVRAVEENYHTKEELEEKYPRIGEIPFDSERKMMTTVHQWGKSTSQLLKEPLMCYYLVLVSEMSIKRLLLMIVSENERYELLLSVMPYMMNHQGNYIRGFRKNLRLLGLIGMIDPPRPESKGAIARAKKLELKQS